MISKQHKKDRMSLVITILLLISLSIYASAQITSSARFSPIYQNKTEVQAVYENKETVVNYRCVLDNKTMIESDCQKTIIEPVFKKMETVVIESKLIGYTDGQRDIIKPYINSKDNIVSIWSYPIGSRNLDEFGRCRQYEKDKGVCYEIS